MRLAQIEAKKLHRINLVDAFGPVGQVEGAVQVVQEHPDDFTKAQRHNGQVVTAQLERGRTQHHPEKPCQGGSRRDGGPDGQVQAFGEGCGNRRKSLRQMRRTEQHKQIGA